jgi:hypothetical protein
LAPVAFSLSRKLNSTLKGRRFQTIEEISLWDLRAIPRNAFQDVFQNWKIRWERCKTMEGSTLKETSLIKLLALQ